MRPILLALLLLSLPSPAAEWQGECVAISDGDTISVMHDGKPEKIRVYGIDCPESKQDFGQRAKQFTADMTHRKTVTITPIDTDRYGRTVALVDVDGVSLNRELVAAGLAWVYPQYCKLPQCAEWKALEAEARDARRGLWAQPGSVPPWEWRRGKTPEQPREAVAATFHGNVKSRVFHRATCRHFNCQNCTASFASRDAAVGAGYRPCGVCKP